jgi:hypothetical protein
MCGNSKQPKKRIEYRGNILRVYGTEGVSPSRTLSRDVDGGAYHKYKSWSKAS